MKKKFLVFFANLIVASLQASEDNYVSVQEINLQRIELRSETQIKISEISERNVEIKSQIEEKKKEIERLSDYALIMKKQIAKQITLQSENVKKIEEITATEKHLVPLMLESITNLKTFINSDLPFHLDERKNRVAYLLELIVDPQLTLSQKFSKIMEAYQIERDYGSSIESYDSLITPRGVNEQVTILRVGRIGLYYVNINKKNFGTWNKETNFWEAVNDHITQENIIKGIKIANEVIPPDILTLPVYSKHKLR